MGEVPPRSVLFVPGNRADRILKALSSQADAVVVDLEDAVPSAAKNGARITLRRLRKHFSSLAKIALVRINSLGSGQTTADLAALAVVRTDGLVIPKVENPEQIGQIMDLVKKARVLGRQDRHPKLWLIIESPKGLLNVEAIGSAHPRIQALCFGAVDYTRELGCDLDKDPRQTLYARSKIAIAAKACNLWAIDTVFPDFEDRRGLLLDSQFGRKLGFHGRLVIHPKQIETVNRVFSISARQIRRARRIVEAFERRRGLGIGAISVDGQMIDNATYERARQTLADRGHGSS